jgi:hypothetical protein
MIELTLVTQTILKKNSKSIILGYQRLLNIVLPLSFFLRKNIKAVLTLKNVSCGGKVEVEEEN